MEYSGSTVLITGASSGIGRKMAMEFASRGVRKLILSSTKAADLEALADELSQQYDVETETSAVDLSQPGAATKLFKSINHNQIDIFCNNAGFGTYGEFVDLPLDKELSEIMVNVVASTELSHHVLTQMKQRGRGSIVTTSSTAAFQPLPYSATYGATKAFVLSHSLALWEEARHYGVKVHALCPGPTKTKFFEHAGKGAERMIITDYRTVDQLMQTLFRLLDSDKPMMIDGFKNNVAAQLSRIVTRKFSAQNAAKYLTPHR